MRIKIENEHEENEVEFLECDKCQKRFNSEESEWLDAFSVKWQLWREIFKGRQECRATYGKDFCYECSVLITPYMFRFRQIADLNTQINKLKKVTNERNKNNRTT